MVYSFLIGNQLFYDTYGYILYIVLPTSFSRCFSAEELKITEIREKISQKDSAGLVSQYV